MTGDLQFPTWTLTLLLGIIVILVVFFKTKLSKEKSDPREREFELFLEEWQKENEALLRALAEMQNDVLGRLDDVQQRVALLEAKAKDSHAAEAAAPKSRNEHESIELSNRYADIFEMAKNGISVADIARKTGRGNGEIQLILKLAARGDGS